MSPDELLQFFKALADANRLRIVGLLAHRAYAVEELASALELRASTVSHHLKRLSDAGLVRSEAQGHYHVYALDLERLQQRSKALGEPAVLRAMEPPDPGVDAYAAKVLETFTDADGRFTQFPMQRKKFAVLLHHALTAFPDDGPWDEPEVNERLKRFTKDTATIRRGFVDHGLMTRDPGGRGYRKTAAEGA